MSWIDRALPAERSPEDVRYFLQIALLTFFAYLIAAELAHFLTKSSRRFGHQISSCFPRSCSLAAVGAGSEFLQRFPRM